MLLFQVLVIRRRFIWARILLVVGGECLSWGILLGMALFRIGMIWRYCGNMLLPSWRYLPMSILCCSHNPIWTLLNRGKKYLRYSLRSFKCPQFQWLNKVSSPCTFYSILFRFATGKSTGIVLDSGDGVSHVVPVYEGYSI